MEHIASLSSLKAATDRLLQAAATLDEGNLGGLGRELSAVGDLLARQPGLRRTLSEATTAPEQRAGIMARLLSGKVGDPTAKVVDFAVRQDWSSGADLRDAFVRLGRTAMFLRAERAGDLDEVEDQLFRFGRIVDSSPELSVILDDPTVDGDARAHLVDRLLAHRAHPLTVELTMALARNPGGRAFAVGLRDLVDQAAQRTDKVVAFVESAVALSADDTRRLTSALGRIYSRPVAVHTEVAPGLAGGMRVRVGDEVIDGSVSGRLAALRRRLAG